MPDTDLVLNVRQIAGYPTAGSTGPSDSLLIQQGGLGGPYASIAPSALVETALSTGGVMSIAGALQAQTVNAGSATFSNAAIGLLTAPTANITTLSAISATLAGVPIATTAFVSGMVAALQAATVWSFNGRRGDVFLWLQDVLKAGGAPIYSPRFMGAPMADTPAPNTCNSRLATTAFVHGTAAQYVCSLLKDHPFVFTFNGRTGDVVLTPDDIGNVEGALLNSPALQGTPTAPTAPPLTNNTQLATTAYTDSAVSTAVTGLSGVYAPINSPAFTGVPLALTANPGTSTGQLATCAFVMNAVAESTAGVASFNGRTGIVTLEDSDITNAGGALLDSPIFTGTPQAPTVAPADNSNKIATTSWVLNEIGGATIGVMSFNGRGGAVVLNTSDITGAGGAPIVAPNFSGVPTAPTAPTNTSTNQLATCAFVMSAVTQGSVVSFNGRTGAVTLTNIDVSAAGGLTNPSVALTGVPTAPTAAPSTSSTQLATTAFVTAAIAALGGVASWNGRTGAVTLTAADLVPFGGPFLPLAGGTVSGNLIVANAGLFIQAAAGGSCAIYGQKAGVSRWDILLGDPTAESGSNAGSNFTIQRFSDSGAYLDNPLTITRADGSTHVWDGLWSENGQAYLNGASNIQKTLWGQTSGVLNWGLIMATADANADFALARMTNGVYSDTPLRIASANALFTLYASDLKLGASISGALDGNSFGLKVCDGSLNQRGVFIYNFNQSITGMGNSLGTTGMIQVNYDGSFQISSATAIKPGGGSWAGSSDARIKEVEADYTFGLAAIRKLKPVIYRYLGNDTPTADINSDPLQDSAKPKPRVTGPPYPASPHYQTAKAKTSLVGLVAQEVEAFFPRMVTKRDGFIDGKPVKDVRDLNPNELIFALINAVKELALRIETLEARA